ncbi:MAG: 2,3-bisphosphoglycerate-independent phosphoglycerate mutase [Xanthomonadales bacterium]|jgi:2,3-bisphosphoglycerate-independent phosphoglycerate mutase|nr:2,3-bisphosphoglycerate-independent phosphoglycerate mutase [Xanthomonadales bacterium]
MSRKPHLLLILDGFGHREAAEHNAIAQAQTPNWTRIRAQYPHTLLCTHGLAVGLPDEQMGNSEVGHMNLGAGRIVYQDLTRINLALEEGSFARNPALQRACAAARRMSSCLHVAILLSDGGVHSLQAHLHAFLRMASKSGAPLIQVHAFLDGRDTPPRSARQNLERLQALLAGLPRARLASVGGRYYGMDRDQRWERVTRAWEVIVEARADHVERDGLAALEAAYARGENDEFVQPTLIAGARPMRDDDVFVFLNFRADRARQLTRALVDPDFAGFVPARRPRLAHVSTLTQYEAGLPVDVAYAPQSMAHTLPEVLAERGHTQLRIAETEKYAHVTFFFNGGREDPWPGEDRILVPSPKVATYDLQPEMSCPEVTQKLVDAIGSGRYDVLVCNIANPDMVGHTGVMSAAIRAVEAVDAALGQLEAAILAAGGDMLITADHGNLEEMWDPVANQPNTQHSLNPVPLVLIGRAATLATGGSLQDVAPTLLELMGIAAPAEMTGRSLIQSPQLTAVSGELEVPAAA